MKYETGGQIVIKKNMNIFGIMLFEIFMCIPFFSSRIGWFGHVAILTTIICFSLLAKNSVPRSILYLVMYLISNLFYYLRVSGDIKDYIIRSFALISISIIIPRYENISNKNKKLLIIIFIISNLITQLITIYYASKDSEIVRNIMHGKSSGFGIADFNNIYIYTIYSIPLYFSMVRNKGKIKCVFILLLVLNIYTIINASFLTAILILLLSLISLFIESNNKKRKRIIAISILSIVFIFIKINLQKILIFIISNLTFSVSLNVRLNEILSLYQNRFLSSNTDLSSRIVAYSNSFSTFYHNILFGKIAPMNTSYNLIGGHSDVLDKMGGLGLLSVFYFLFLIICYKTSSNNVDWRNRSKYFSCWIIYLINSILNPAENSYFLFFLCIIFPAFFDTYAKGK